MRTIQVIDSHTGGEPTRVIIAGGPDLGSGSLAQRRELFRREFDAVRRAVVCEPRGSDVLVGAMLCPPTDSTCVAGVIFFNNVGYLGMCGHGLMGVAVTLGHLGRVTAGRHRLETPVGIVPFDFDGHHAVSLDNVPSYRFAKNVRVNVPRIGEICGDVAWGGNWFFLVNEHDQTLQLTNVDQLTTVTEAIRSSLKSEGITGADGAEIDHVELFGQPHDPMNQGRTFVLCPGGAYDRSPCGTGTSAKLACLAAERKLKPGETWRQESIIGSVFSGSYQAAGDRIIPTISGQAYVTAEATLILDEPDPFAFGMVNIGPSHRNGAT